MFSIIRSDGNVVIRQTAVNGFVEYVQNRLEVTQALKQYALYLSLNLCSLGSWLKTSPDVARKSHKED